MTRLETFVRFTDGTGRTEGEAVENTPANRRALDRAARLLMGSARVLAVEVSVVQGSSPGFARSRGSYR